jgi:molybdate transport system ATP-binding protein
MSLSFSASLVERDFDVSFSLESGRTLAVLGPNGAGKSTLLGLLAGLLAPTTGRAELDGNVLFDVTAGRGPLIEARRRGVALLAQDALLFPHLSVLDNVAFGPRSRGQGRTRARSTARTWLDRVGVPDLAPRRPAELSGGQAQRVAVARALAADPSLLLLDEPLAALDVTVAPALRTLLRTVLADRSAIIVTHDPLDALLLADQVLILEAGRIAEAGPTREVLTRPVTAFGARLAGLNLVTGERTPSGFRGGNGLDVPFGQVRPEGQRLGLAVRPTGVAVGRRAGHEPGWSWIRAVVDDVEHHGDLVRVSAAGLAADVMPADVVELGITPGTEVFLGVRHQDALIYAL